MKRLSSCFWTLLKICLTLALAGGLFAVAILSAHLLALARAGGG